MDNSGKVDNGLDLTNRFALDTQGFDTMRQAVKASPKEGVKMAAKQFDAVFTSMMLKSMREATPSDGPLDSHDGDQFQSMMDEQLAQQMSNRGIGVANAMVKQLMRSMGGGDGESGDAGGVAGLAMGSAGAGGAAGLGGADAGKLAMLNALGRAYGNAAANGALSKGNSGYPPDDALVPPDRLGVSGDTVNAFVDKLGASAQAASDQTGIPARFIMGQAALESGWGKREIRKADGTTSYNVFGIKATKDWTGKTVQSVTTEYIGGHPQRVVQRFRAYDSYDEAMTDYANLLSNNPRYAQVLNNATTAAGFAQGMQRAGYATDPHYARKLMAIMQKMT